VSPRKKKTKPFNLQLRAEMEKAEMTIDRLAEIIGCSRGVINNYRRLNAPQEPTRSKLLAIRDALGCSIQDLT